jgi:hypothetical protein
MQLLNPKKNTRNILPIFVVATFSVHLISFLVLMFHWSMLQKFTNQQVQGFVQLTDGRAIAVSSQEYLERNPQTIQRMVGETLTLMFTASEKQPPPVVWQTTSQLLSDSLQQKFQPEVTQANLASIRKNTNTSNESLLLLQSISQPKKIAEGKWQVDALANRLIFTVTNRSGDKIPFNKRILVRAIDNPKIVLPAAPTPLNLAVYRLGEAKLEIYNICDIKDKTCN